MKAQQLGYQSPLLTTLLETIAPDGGEDAAFSNNLQADAVMREGEAAFVQGDLDKALAAYQRALALDPKLYVAALFAGDMYNRKGQFEQAAQWFARAVAINPDIEPAYCYWGDSLMQQGRMREARDKFVEAVIADPYNRLAWGGLIVWANRNNVRLAHPRIEPPYAMSAERATSRSTLIQTCLVARTAQTIG